MNDHHRFWWTSAAAAELGQLGVTQNHWFALLRSNFQALAPTLFFIYQGRATQLELCHTLTDTLSHTIHNHCSQLPSCSHLTVSVWWSLYGISGCSGKQNLWGMENGWFFLNMFSPLILSVDISTILFFLHIRYFVLCLKLLLSASARSQFFTNKQGRQ